MNLHRLNNLDLGFSLVKPGNIQASPSIAEVKLLRNRFPSLRNVIHYPPYLVLVVDTVPTWIPRSISNIPVHFTMNEGDIPLRGEWCRGPPLTVGDVTPVWVLPSFETRREILKLLVSHGVRSIGWAGTRWLLEVEKPDKTTRASLPRLINGLVATYRPYSQLSEHGIQRSKIPSSLEIDNMDYYPCLHAGMLLSDGGDTLTTSGCPLQREGDSDSRFFSIASHGFVTGGDVYYSVPDPLGRKIGVADIKIGETGIGVCRITDQDMEYTADCFTGEKGTVRLKSLKAEGECWIGKPLYVDSPFCGLGVGIVEMHGITVIPGDKADPAWNYVSNLWVSFESGAEDYLPGCCGSALFDDEGDVYAFFRYFRIDGPGTSYCPCPDSLIKAGFSLATQSPCDSGNVSDMDEPSSAHITKKMDRSSQTAQRPQKVRPPKPKPGQPSKADRQIPISPILSKDNSFPVPLIDIGANLTGRSFSKHSIPKVLQRASQAGVAHIIITGTSYSGSKSALELCNQFDGTEGVTLRCTVGIHPHDATSTLNGPHAKSFDKGLEGLIGSELGKKYCVAVGECGLDYDRKFSTHEDQKVVFEKQLQLAQKLGKPVFLHSREAHTDFLSILKPYLSTIKAVAHCHTDPSVQHLKELLDAGVYIGLTGMICDEREGKFNTDILQHIPLDRLMVETDSPYLFPRNVPRPWGKWENEPCLTSYVIRKIVEVCPQYSEEEVALKTTEVAKALFGL